ncbi:UbiA family prenyltransferase [Agromyces binzhouensis]|uniref:1,4-dihydroxy-2-naphthoate prenyltransferase n=1 Tax=Agromyces binzhouensis TaxID=1817495 RepID=A0A4Q2JET2_9MICO|nr:UbiA family prenyltransferase [Agromyces binzhouensis]RXZ46271.1 1,4-dihydroxy-2-naphthoate prenyltransferase [Agromyces binzhouensis]
MSTPGALWRSSHPGPTSIVTALASALGWSAGLDPARIVLLALAVLAGQLSVGISNDAIDAPRDRIASRPDKPIARGEVTLAVAWGAALVSLATALTLSALLGAGMLAAHALALGSAWAYNAWLKSTPASIVPFLVSFGIFPSLATLSAPQPAVAPGWTWIAGAALGAAVHLTNVLPDLDQDAATGVRGLPHRLGPRVSAAVAACAVVAGAVVVLIGSAGGEASVVSAISWAFFAGVVVVAVATLLAALLRPPSRTLFRLVMLAALLLAAQLVAAGRVLAG